MVASGLHLDDVVARARSLRECLLETGSLDVREPATVERWLERWRAAVEPDGTDWFEKRLRWRGPRSLGRRVRAGAA